MMLTNHCDGRTRCHLDGDGVLPVLKEDAELFVDDGGDVCWVENGTDGTSTLMLSSAVAEFAHESETLGLVQTSP